MWFGSRQMLEKLTDADLTLDTGTSVIRPVKSVRDLDVHLESELTMKIHISPGSRARRARCRSTAGFSIHFITTRLLQLTVVSSAMVNCLASVACHDCSCTNLRCATTWNQRWSSYIGWLLSKELHTSCVCSCTTSTTEKHHNTCQTVYPQFLQPVADTGWGWLTQRFTFCRCLEQEPDLENVLFLLRYGHLWPRTLFLPTFTTLLIPVHSENETFWSSLPLTIFDARGRVE